MLAEFKEDDPCIKCGYELTGVRYEEARLVVGSFIQPHPERLQVTCRRCGFCWYRAPLDRKES